MLKFVKNLCSSLNNFVVSEEQFNASFVLKNAIQLIFLVSIVAIVKMILLKSNSYDERLIAAYVYIFLGSITFLGALQTLLVFLNSSKNKVLSIFFTLYFILMIIGIYIVQLIIRLKI